MTDSAPGRQTFSISLGNWQEMAGRATPVRMEVFVREQGVPAEIECDEFDAVSRHALALDAEGRAIGTGRLLPDGHVGRMAVLAAWRGRGVGAALLAKLVACAREQGMVHLELSAQVHAQAFYARYGFTPVGGEYLEAGIPHRTMFRDLD